MLKLAKIGTFSTQGLIYNLSHVQYRQTTHVNISTYVRIVGFSHFLHHISRSDSFRRNYILHYYSCFVLLTLILIVDWLLLALLDRLIIPDPFAIDCQLPGHYLAPYNRSQPIIVCYLAQRLHLDMV